MGGEVHTRPVGNTAALVRVLGTVEVVGAGGEVHQLPSVSQRRLVAVLAVNAGHTVRGEFLADLLDVTTGALRTTVSRLRRQLGADVVHTDPVGYRLVADVDAHRFTELLAATADDVDPLDRLDAALGLWQGDAFDEFAHEPWARTEATRLAELRSVAIERRTSALIAHGRFGEAVAAVEALIATHPLRDRPRGLLMEALASDGRQAEALRSYQQYRSFLADTAGTEPSAEVQRLERRIAEGDVQPSPAPSGGGEERRARARDDRGAATPPAFRSAFVGRHDEVRSVLAALRTHRVVTLVGEGGVGKTRLAVEAAALLPTELPAWFVDLAAIDDVHVVAVAAALAAGVRGTDDPAAVAALLAERRGLLLLDNGEHVRSGAAAVAAAVARACPHVTVLVTSREALGVPDENVVRVAPLAADGAAAELFYERAEGAGAAMWPHQHRTVASICRQLDGNPLAIEIAATRVAALGLDTVRAGLDDRFAVLADDRAGVADRHRSLRATVEWSYRLLPRDEQQLFRRLGGFTGGFELDALQHVVGALGGSAPRAVGHLASLVDRSMVVADQGATTTRFRLLDTLRAFAQAEAHEHGETDAVADAHADWVASLTDVDHVAWMTGPCHRQALRLEREVPNWRAAFEHARRGADVGLARRLCGASSALLAWGRPDLDAVVQSHAGLLLADDPRRACIALASWGPAWAALDFAAMEAVEDRLQAVEPDDGSGARAVIASARELVMGDVPAAIARRQAAIDDPTVALGARHYCNVLALYLTCSSGAVHLRRPEWIDAVTAVVDRSDVAVNRFVGRVGLAWALADRDPVASDEWLRAVLAPDEPMPAFHRTLAGAFASRLLITRAPALAAARLHEVLSAADREPGMTDSIALVTAAGLLASAAHPIADDVVATLALRSATSYLGNLVPDMVDRRGRGRVLAYDVLVARLLDALAELAAATTN